MNISSTDIMPLCRTYRKPIVILSTTYRLGSWIKVTEALSEKQRNVSIQYKNRRKSLIKRMELQHLFITSVILLYICHNLPLMCLWKCADKNRLTDVIMLSSMT